MRGMAGDGGEEDEWGCLRQGDGQATAVAQVSQDGTGQSKGGRAGGEDALGGVRATVSSSGRSDDFPKPTLPFCCCERQRRALTWGPTAPGSAISDHC